MTFLYLILYYTPGRAPCMNVLFWGPGDFPVSYSNRDTSWNAWNRHSRSFMVDTGILFSNMKCPLTNDKWHSGPWPVTVTSQPIRLFTNFHDLDTVLDLHRITSGFHGAFATGVACQQGTLTLPDTWFRPPFGDLLMLQLLKAIFPSLPCLFPTFTLNTPRYFLDFAWHRYNTRISSTL